MTPVITLMSVASVPTTPTNCRASSHVAVAALATIIIGMRNLTARRCQHDGCFTVANFGFPGDKPGYCAAHSTEGTRIRT